MPTILREPHKPVFVTESGPDADWHAAIETKNHNLLAHTTFLDREGADAWVEEELHRRGTEYMGMVAYATICPHCNRN